MSKVIDFSNQNKPFQENSDLKGNSQENNEEEQLTNDRDCPRFDYCAAPICPLDSSSLKNGIFYPDEEICQLQAFCHEPWIRNQKRIAQKCKDKGGYFNLEMLSHNCQIKGGITGLDPDKTDIDDSRAIKNWLKAHPKKREISKEERQKRRSRMIELNKRSTPSENTRQLRKIDTEVASQTRERQTTDESHTKLPLSHYSVYTCTKNAV